MNHPLHISDRALGILVEEGSIDYRCNSEDCSYRRGVGHGDPSCSMEESRCEGWVGI